ncbi:hypothetical protein [Marinobacter xestospongiae]|uniref:Uncharacterized protein n=1 Tax=Marinobacter xestospongiae TaxID=994319 RepID=A0ABU3W2D0_9GAMM|nr:hypothetical protein [Marinobacter xestospongiae]MDV2080698.1 hypothetical protein [Marinobacter xestospongiae]
MTRCGKSERAATAKAQENCEDVEDWYGILTKDVAARIRAWAKVYGIRQF